MNRRTALGLAAALPALAQARSSFACTLVGDRPEDFATRLPDIARLFDQWIRREEEAFLETVYGPVAGEGLDRLKVLRELASQGERPNALELYGQYFNDPARHPRLHAISAIGNHAFVAVNDQSPGGIGADCSGLPILRLFLVTFRPSQHGARIASLAHVASETWSGHGQTAHWAQPA